MTSWEYNSSTDSSSSSLASASVSPARRISDAMASFLSSSVVTPAAIEAETPFYNSADPIERQRYLVHQAQRVRKDGDINFLLDNPKEFARLKKELRRSGAVTNTVLMHGIHFYARSRGNKLSSR